MPIVIGTGGSSSSSAGLTTYWELRASIEEWLNRADLEDRVPDFIKLFEAELNRILRVPEMETDEDLTIDAEREDLPTDFLQARALYLDTDPRLELEAISLGALRTKYAIQTTGKPEAYAISGSEIVFGPAPDASYDGKLTYYAKIPALTASNTTNWVLTSHPDIYLFGTLLMAEAFIFNDERLPLWRNAFDNAIAQLQSQGHRKQYGAAGLRLRPSVSE